jgi:hypothetical protein
VSAETIAARARERDSAWIRQAAAIVLAVVIAGAAYAVPGSPVRAWVGAIAGWMGARQEPSSVTRPSGQTTAPISGLAVSPGQKFLIWFSSRQTEGQVRVSLSDGAMVVVRGPAGAARYSSSVDRLVIDNLGATADFELQIPRAAPWIEIRMDDERILLKEGSRVTTAGSASPGGSYVLPLGP